LLGGGNVTVLAWDLLGDGELGTGREGTSAGGVENSGVWASSVSGDDVHGSGDGSTWADLSQGGSGLGHDRGHAGESVGASLGLSEAVGHGVLACEDGGIDFGLLVGTGTWDDSSLDTETSGVSTSITSLICLLDVLKWKGMVEKTYHDCDLAMGGDQRRCYKSKDEELGEHVEGWGFV
jgi:hypothetical protein